MLFLQTISIAPRITVAFQCYGSVMEKMTVVQERMSIKAVVGH